nr:hypothetical protein HUO10_004480 [Paraburkholderia busanensis]
MIFRVSSVRAMFARVRSSRVAATASAAAVLFALNGAGVNSAVAAPADAASAPDAASVSYANGGQFTIKPGQSLNDVAIAVTQSHDRATLARASRALFDANPNAFMSHDPSRMRLGAVLTVPVLDASGALAASSAAVGASAPAGASAAMPAGASSAAVAAPAPSSTAAASAAAQANAATAGASSAAAHAAAPAAAVVSGASGATPEASPAMAGSTAATASGVASSAPVAGSSAAGAAASGTHEWSGSIQQSASGAVEGASATTAGAQAASQPRAQVSSLQQLLALKNRVLMELQKHGIGGSPTATRAASAGTGAPVAGASSGAAQSSHGGTGTGAAGSTALPGGFSQTELSIAAAIGAALVVLLAALRMRRRKRAGAAPEQAVSVDDEATASARMGATPDADAAGVAPTVVHDGSADAHDDAAVQRAAALAAAEREAAEGKAAEREQLERQAAEREAEERRAAALEAERAATEQAAAERAAADQAATERAATERLTAEQAAAERAASERADAERAAAEHAAGEQQAAEQAAARAAEERAETERAAAERAAAEQAAAASTPPHRSAEISPTQPMAAASEFVAPEHLSTPGSLSEPAHPTHDFVQPGPSDSPIEPLPAAHHDNLDSATTAASLAAAAELGADALPRTPLEPVDEIFPQPVPEHRLQWDDEPAPSASVPPVAEPAPATQPQNPPIASSSAGDFTQQPAESRETPPPFGQPYADASAHPLPDLAPPPVLEPLHGELPHQPSYELHQPTQAASPDGASTLTEPVPLSQAQHPLTAPNEFPRDAVDAFSSLDMPLPPRIDSMADGIHAPASLTTQPVASPETTAQQAFAPHDPDDAPHIADEINAGTAGHASVAGLGAAGFGASGAGAAAPGAPASGLAPAGLGVAGFGALNLDFDLELPPSPAQPLPAFTPADLARIARNKLDLAAEYIDLGDLSGARALIHEVIEANDPATRTEARALLSTLAPLS